MYNFLSVSGELESTNTMVPLPVSSCPPVFLTSSLPQIAVPKHANRFGGGQH
jgi:hypothetical protein